VQAIEPATLFGAQGPAYPFTSPARQRYAEVGGWILFFCAVHVVIGPIRLWSHHSATPTATDWLYRALVVFGVVAGVLLVTRAAYALDVLKIYFLAAFLLNAIVLLQVMRGVTGAFDDGSMTIGGRPLGGVVSTTIWFLYFRTSQRVKATYGRNL
jgi:hypothetical protein